MTEIESYRRVGKGRVHHAHDFKRGYGYKDRGKFIFKLIDNYIDIADHQIKGANDIVDPAFAYTEKQSNTILAPAFFRFCDTFLSEYRVDRKYKAKSRIGNDESYGFLDYLCFYNKKAFAIEVKCHNIKVNIRDSLKDLWDNMHGAFKSIREDQKILKEYSNGLYTVKLMISPILRTSSKKEDVLFYDENELKDYVPKLHKMSKKQANFIAIWEFNESQRVVYESDEGFYGYSGIAFTIEISKMKF